MNRVAKNVRDRALAWPTPAWLQNLRLPALSSGRRQMLSLWAWRLWFGVWVVLVAQAYLAAPERATWWQGFLRSWGKVGWAAG